MDFVLVAVIGLLVGFLIGRIRPIVYGVVCHRAKGGLIQIGGGACRKGRAFFIQHPSGDRFEVRVV